MIIEPAPNNDNSIFESHFPQPARMSKFPDLSDIRERALSQQKELSKDSQKCENPTSQTDVEVMEENNELEECWNARGLGEEALLASELDEYEKIIFDEEFYDAEEEVMVQKDEMVKSEEEVLYNKEEVVVQKDEMIKSEEDIAQIDEDFANQEKEAESQLSTEGVRVERESETDLSEGSLKAVEGDEKTHQVNADIEQEINPKISENNANLRVIEHSRNEVNCSIHLYQSLIHQPNGLSTQNDLHTKQDHSPSISNNVRVDVNQVQKNKHGDDWVRHVIQANFKKLNELVSQKRVDFQSIHEAIKYRLQLESFRNICNENGIPLHEDEAGIGQLTQDILDFQQNYPEEKLTQIIQHRIVKWLGNKNLHMKDAQGNLIKITPKRRRELAIILFRGIVIEIVYQVTYIQQTLKENKVEDEHASNSLNSEEREVKQPLFYRIHGQKFKLDSFYTIGDYFNKTVFNVDAKIKNAKHIEESNKENVNLSNRIIQMVIFKEIIKGVIVKDEIEHLDENHVIAAIDRVKLRKLKAINGTAKQQREKIPKKIESELSDLKGRIYVS